MLYSDHPRVHYDKPQLAEVICQLRFPAILSARQVLSRPISTSTEHFRVVVSSTSSSARTPR